MTNAFHIERLRVVRRRSGQRVVVETDTGKQLEVDPEIVVRHRLKRGDPISEEMIERLRREDESLAAKRRLTRYLALRVKSVADARLYLEKAGFGERAVAEAIAHAEERGLLDDRVFAERYVRTRLKTSLVGPLRLLGDLISRGVAPPLAEEVLKPWFDRQWQLDAAEKVGRKRLKAANKGASSPAEARKKLARWLSSRGFEPEIVREVAERLVSET